MIYRLIYTSKFKSDYKLLVKQGKDIEKLHYIVRLLQNNEMLPVYYHDHPIKGQYKDCRELHLEPDWLLIYKIDSKNLILVLTRSGSHTNLFDKKV